MICNQCKQGELLYDDGDLQCDNCHTKHPMCETFKEETKESIMNFLFKHRNDNISIQTDFYYAYFDKLFIDKILRNLEEKDLIEINDKDIKLKD